MHRENAKIFFFTENRSQVIASLRGFSHETNSDIQSWYLSSETMNPMFIFCNGNRNSQLSRILKKVELEAISSLDEPVL